MHIAHSNIAHALLP